jgi:branched-subunit amino acid ABC-type transport system permease component
MALFASVIIFGLVTAAIVAVGALGFTLQYGITNVLNLAYGATMTSVIFATWGLSHFTGSLPLLILGGFLFGAAFSSLINIVIVVPFVRKGTNLVTMAIVTIALGLIIEFSLESIQGPFTWVYPTPGGPAFQILSNAVSTTQILIVLLAGALMLALHLLLRHTRLGLSMRAMSADPSLSRASGIPTGRVRAITWALSGGLCGVAATMLATTVGSFDSTVTDGIFILIVAAAIMGGIGKPYGAMLGALCIGLVSAAVSAYLAPDLNDVVAAAIIVLTLLVRPQGLLGDFAASRELVA